MSWGHEPYLPFASERTRPAIDSSTALTMQYLERHAEPEARALPALPGTFAHAVVIPAYGEAEQLLQTLATVPGPATLAVVVLNARADAPAWAHAANAQARSLLHRAY